MIYYRFNQNYISVMGQTYPHKELIKSLGGIFVSNRKIWQIPFDEKNLEKINTYCLKNGGGPIDESGEFKNHIDKKSFTNKQDQAPLSIAQLYFNIETILSKHLNSYYWIVGELENVSFKSKSIFLTLAEKDHLDGSSTTISALVWTEKFKSLHKKHGEQVILDLFQEGMKVCLKAEVRVYKGRGNISLLVQDIDPIYTKGDLALKKEAVIKSLKVENLYSLNKQKYLGDFPFKIGLISAQSSRAYSDFCHQLFEGGFCGDILFAACHMQGPSLAKELKSCVKELEKQRCDLIVITRGGGSAADLRWFDTYEVARVVTDCQKPILAAIGHHDDVCVLEEIAFAHLKTPTAAAVFIKQWFQKTAQKIENIEKEFYLVAKNKCLACEKHYTQKIREFSFLTTKIMEKNEYVVNEYYVSLNRSLENRLRAFFLSLQDLSSVLWQKVQSKILSHSLDMDKFLLSLSHSAKEKFSNTFLFIELLSAKLAKKDPRPWLERGWSRLYKKEKVIRSIKDITVNDQLSAYLRDGKLTLEVKDKNKGKKYEKQ